MRYEGGRDAIMMTLHNPFCPANVQVTDLHFLHTHHPQEGLLQLPPFLPPGGGPWRERATPSTKFVLCRGPPKNNAGVEERKARPNEHTTSGIGMNREVVFGFRNSPWLPLICIPISNRISHDDRGERADSTRPDSRFSFTVT